MTTHRISLENSYCNFTFVPLPKQVKRVADLPNWFITLADAKTDQAVKVYLQIQHNVEAGPVDIRDAQNTIDYVTALLTDPKFIGQFGELKLNGAHMRAPNEEETYRVGKEFHNFFQRRGRNTKTVIEAAGEFREPYTGTRSKKITPITLSLDSDVVFKTTASRSTFKRNYKCISGSVVILGQHHYFELSHPIFDLSLMMTGGDARKNITQGLKKAFPFISGESAIYDWTFDNQVQGK